MSFQRKDKSLVTERIVGEEKSFTGVKEEESLLRSVVSPGRNERQGSLLVGEHGFECVSQKGSNVPFYTDKGGPY